jgi:CDP-diacylglycerol--serine O-phosphatidyltransferase
MRAKNGRELAANLLTFLGLFCGFASIILCLEGYFAFAAWAIILGAIFDGLDGQTARLSQVPNEFGKHFDSLVDAVTFGIAPAILGYAFVYKKFQIIATLVLFIYLASSVVRLARYNAASSEKTAHYFHGLPTTASGGFLASLVLIYISYGRSVPPVIFLLLVLTLACLMLSRVRYLNLDGLKKLVLNKIVIAIFALVLIAAVFVPQIVLILFFSAYIIFAPFASARPRAK